MKWWTALFVHHEGLIISPICGDEMTRTWFWPSCKSMAGPYFLERFHRERWLPSPIWWRLPMMGIKLWRAWGKVGCFLHFPLFQKKWQRGWEWIQERWLEPNVMRENRFIIFVWWCRKSTCALKKLHNYVRLHVGLIFR